MGTVTKMATRKIRKIGSVWKRENNWQRKQFLTNLGRTPKPVRSKIEQGVAKIPPQAGGWSI